MNGVSTYPVVSKCGASSTISYTFDAANRLTNITLGSNSVVLAPDAANRPGTITYPNGIVGTYGFDAANQLLSLSYAKGSTFVGALGYTYDLAGRQITKTGTLATLVMPTAVSQTTYDAANRLTMAEMAESRRRASEYWQRQQQEARRNGDKK